MTDIKFESMPGGVRAFGTDSDVSMDDLAAAMFEAFLRSEAKLRESGQSLFDKPEGDPDGLGQPLLRTPADGNDPGKAR